MKALILDELIFFFYFFNNFKLNVLKFIILMNYIISIICSLLLFENRIILFDFNNNSINKNVNFF